MKFLDEQPVLYSQPDCPGCDSVRDFFASHGIPYLERDIAHDSEAYHDFLALGLPSTPVIVVAGRKILGFQRRMLEEALGLQKPGHE